MARWSSRSDGCAARGAHAKPGWWGRSRPQCIPQRPVFSPLQISEKTSQERDRGGCGVVGGSGSCSSVGGAGSGERSADRPRTSPSQRLLSTHHHHHHLGYSLLPAQYNLPYATGESLTSSLPGLGEPEPLRQALLWPPPALPSLLTRPLPAGLSSTAIVASQQGSAPSLYPPPRR